LREKGSQWKVINVKFHNARSVGKPRKRWERTVQRDALNRSEEPSWE
jgi:hypothetical protein